MGNLQLSSFKFHTLKPYKDDTKTNNLSHNSSDDEEPEEDRNNLIKRKRATSMNVSDCSDILKFDSVPCSPVKHLNSSQLNEESVVGSTASEFKMNGLNEEDLLREQENTDFIEISKRRALGTSIIKPKKSGFLDQFDDTVDIISPDKSGISSTRIFHSPSPRPYLTSNVVPDSLNNSKMDQADKSIISYFNDTFINSFF